MSNSHTTLYRSPQSLVHSFRDDFWYLTHRSWSRSLGSPDAQNFRPSGCREQSASHLLGSLLTVGVKRPVHTSLDLSVKNSNNRLYRFYVMLHTRLLPLGWCHTKITFSSRIYLESFSRCCFFLESKGLVFLLPHPLFTSTVTAS